MATAQRTAARPRRQRRAGEELRDAILAAASEVFFEAGYQGASIEAVIERVGGSKRAIYSHFGGKKELFAALVTEASNRALAALSPEEVVGHDLEGTLLAFGRRAIDAVMSPTTLALYRAIVAEGVRFPDLAHIFFERGPGRAGTRLAAVLEGFQQRGEIEVQDCQRAAEHFIGMLRDDLHLRVVLGLRPPPDAAEVEVSVRQAVHIFLNGCRARKRGTTATAAKGKRSMAKTKKARR
jgi:TetR/AcrR family transcriptional regulator, mexJK operon transcriptional repressor